MIPTLQYKNYFTGYAVARRFVKVTKLSAKCPKMPSQNMSINWM